MPLIMDDEDQYMEDLFGDAEQVHVPIAATAPPVKGLAELLNEQAGTGCCQKISWSRFGSIAAVTADGHGVQIFNYVRDSRGDWSLSKPMVAPPGQNGVNLNPIVHVSWSHMGNVLAAVDSHGRLSIYVTVFVQGSPSLQRQNFASDLDDDMHTLVDLHWLPVHPQDSKFYVNWAAKDSGTEWNYRVTQSFSTGPRNPIDTKTCLFTVSRGGLLRLFYEQRDGSWPDISTELEGSPIQVDSALTHASFASFQDDTLALATMDVSGRLRVYQININWNASNQPVNQKEGQNAQLQLNPSFQVKALQTLHVGTPGQSVGEDPTLSSLTDSAPVQLTHFKLLPAPMDRNNPDSTIFIVAVFTSIPSQTGNLLDPAAHYHQPLGIVCRWKVVKDFQHTLSSCFDQLAAKKKNAATVSARKYPQLEQLPDVQLHSTVTSVTRSRNGSLLAFRLSEGTIQYRHFDSLDVVSVDSNQREVHSMPQSGFTFPAIEEGLQIAFSPGQCLMAIRKDDGVVELKPIEYSQGALSDINKDSMNFGRITSLFAIQMSNSVWQYKCPDDLIGFLPKKLSPDFYARIIYETVSALKVDVDFVTEDGQRGLSMYLRNPSLYKILSMQNVLGTNEKGIRNLTAKFAWMTMNLRLSCFILNNVLRHTEALRPEAAISLSGLVKYSTDFLVYILQELFDMFYEIRGKEWDHNFLQKLLYKRNSPALILLFASYTRVQLSMLCQPLRHGQVHALNGVKTATVTEHKQQYAKLAEVFQRSPVTNFRPFEQFLHEIETSARKAYAQAKFDEQQRKAAERDLFWKCEIPEVLVPAIKEILTTKLRPLMEASDTFKIHVHDRDLSWLNFTDDERTRAVNERITVDVIRKVPLNPQLVRLRRCPRCGSVMEDLTPQQLNSQPPWVFQNQKTCVCWSNWVVSETPNPHS